MKDMKLAAQLYTIREYLKTPNEIEIALKKIKNIGYEGIQVSGMGEIAHDDMRRILNETGLKVCSTHIPFKRLQKNINDVIYQHKLWECPNIGVGMIPVEYEKSEEGYTRFAREASKIGVELAKQGFRFTYHNHKFEFEKMNGRLALNILAEESDLSGFDFLLDTYWIQAGGGDVAQWIYKMDGRIKVIHFKDMRINDDKQLMAEVGEGNLNWKQIVKACEETSIEWIAVEQDDCYGEDPFECLKTSFHNLKKML